MISNEIKMHYASPGLYERIVHGLKAIGKSPASVDLDDLATLDEFHLREPAATRELIERLDVGEDSHMLDVGSGLRGPARRLSKAAGCRVRVGKTAEKAAGGKVDTLYFAFEGMPH
jgi:hypothetical protein